MENQQKIQEDEIDLRQYIRVIAKRKKTLIAVSLLTFTIGLVNMLFSPKIYRVSMMIQPPVIGPSLTGANDFESAENLKGLIINGVFNDELRGSLNLDYSNINLGFNVVIPSKTNILKINIDLEEKKKKLGIDLLQELSKSITNRFTKSIEAKIEDISNQIKLKERGIVNTKEKAENLQQQIKEISLREDKLLEELKTVNLTTAEIWQKRDLYLKENVSSGNSLALFLASYLQNNSNYLNQLNNQTSDLSMRSNDLNLELKNIGFQINNLQMEIDKLNIDKNFISNLKIVEQPKVYYSPINSNKKKTLAISIIIGLLLGMLTIFLQEFWVRNLLKE